VRVGDVEGVPLGFVSVSEPAGVSEGQMTEKIENAENRTYLNRGIGGGLDGWRGLNAGG